MTHWVTKFSVFLAIFFFAHPNLGMAATWNAKVSTQNITRFCLGLAKIGKKRSTESALPHVDTRLLAEKRFYREKGGAQTYTSQIPDAKNTRAKAIIDPQEGLLAKVMMIRNAKHTLDLSTYIFTPDESGAIIINELRKAIQRGVSVRVLIDSMGSFNHMHTDLKTLLMIKPGYMVDQNGQRTNLQATVEIRTINSIFSPRILARDLWEATLNRFRKKQDRVPALVRWRNRRSHDKLLIADGDYGDLAAVILGGRNISNHYYGVPKMDADTYNDMEILVRNDPSDPNSNDVGKVIGEHFDRLFYHGGNKGLSIWPIFTGRNLIRQKLEFNRVARANLHESTEVGKKLKEMEARSYLEADLSTGPGFFVNEIQNLLRVDANHRSDGGSSTRLNGASITHNFNEILARAKNSIDIVSPYLYLYPEEMGRLKEWMKEDPKRTIRILTNSLYSADNIAAQALTDKEVGPAFKEYFGEFGGRAQFLTYGKLDADDLGGNTYYGKVHAKFAVVDGSQILITSSNGDPRSRYLNSEVGYIMLSPKIAKELTEVFDTLAAGSYEWGSPEFWELRKHPHLQKKTWMQKKAYPIIQALGLRRII